MNEQPIVHKSLRFSLLDLAPVIEGGSPAESFKNSLELAQHAEQWGYLRYWVAEHHSIPGVASSATAVLIGFLAGGTTHIRVGSGGIMLPNHSPLIIAEQFGTLESLYPGRIDLGLGRAPGGDIATTLALRRNAGGSGDSFPQDLMELRAYFQPLELAPPVRAIPGEGLHLPIYLLGSSHFSAELAAALGLPFAFASHFAPDHLHAAVERYREQFRPSEELERPYVMIGVNLVAADSDETARKLLTSLQLQFVNILRGMPGKLQPPADDMEDRWSPLERAHVERMTKYSAVGSPATVKRELARFAAEVDADELILTGQIYDHSARLRSFEVAARVLSERD